MEEAEVVPMEVFIKLGLLVVESRVPDPSPKGRKEGPHCPSSSMPSSMTHTCEQADFLVSGVSNSFSLLRCITALQTFCGGTASRV